MTDDFKSDWVELTRELVSLGYAVWRAVAPVVASDSPEGHLPMDDVNAVEIVVFRPFIRIQTKLVSTFFCLRPFCLCLFIK